MGRGPRPKQGCGPEDARPAGTGRALVWVRGEGPGSTTQALSSRFRGQDEMGPGAALERPVCPQKGGPVAAVPRWEAPLDSACSSHRPWGLSPLTPRHRAGGSRCWGLTTGTQSLWLDEESLVPFPRRTAGPR